MTYRANPRSIDEYIAGFSPDVQGILQKIRATIRKAAPRAEEAISYQIPAFVFGVGDRVYFAAFKKHIGMYPPPKGDANLRKELLHYRGEKGNLKFPLDEPMPYDLIRRIVECKVKELKGRAPAKRATARKKGP
jgi:uncharacterized protein YdhG (YjbR/CyaY superfamily)